LISHHQKPGRTTNFAPQLKRGLVLSVMLIAALGLSACGNKEKKAGQSIAVVNGEEITQRQLNDELQRANVPAAQTEAASKQLLEALVDRQLLLSEAAKDKTDRDPMVMQNIERAKAQIIAQAYMQKKLAAVAKPSKTEIEEYFNKNPQFFAARKVFEMKQLQMAAKDVNDEVKKMLDVAKTLDEVAAFLTEKKIQFGRGQMSRSGSDLPEQMTSKLVAMPKDQLFMVNEGAVTTLLQVVEMKDAPVALEAAKNQIEQFLLNKKNKEASEAEIKRLRAAGKIEYLKKAAASASASASAAASAPAAAAPATAPATDAAPAAPAATDAASK
jgi:peptidyl-prolyl cis-trans isomerase C